MDGPLRDLYQETIMGHNRSPHNFRTLEHADADAIPTPLQAYGQQQSAEAPKPTLIDELMANKADVTSPPTDSPERPLMSQNPANISLTPFS